MNNYLRTFIVGISLLMPAFVWAATQENLADRYFSDNNPQLTAQEKAALAIAKQWQTGDRQGAKPAMGPDGSIRFVFGAQQPSIVCAVLEVCDVVLQPGERVNSVHLGDSARWSVEPAVTGSGAGSTQHLIIKPTDVGLETSLIVTTDRRTYHLRLRSHRRKYMPKVSFVYPREALNKWRALHSREVRQRADRTLPETGEYLGNLDFDYNVTGNAPWKPVRVYNDGRKTIIQMASKMSQTEAPTLLVLRKEGGLFTDDETALVNYRVHGDRYIVDTVFDKAILIAGVGSSQERVTIARGN